MRRALTRGVAVTTLALSALVGTAIGIGGFTFVYAKGASYMTDDPSACANCHIMNEQYAGWRKASHHTVAVCNDCHAPKDFLGKYTTKALNGWHHSVAFTTGDFPEPIRITPRNREITEAQCRYCHQELVQAIDTGPRMVTAPAPVPAAASAHTGEDFLSCIRCHRNVGHPEE
ncbi:MAG TPA: cytochrome c nitrite reductase small subunit [Myxococcaceae bacterium]|jgi:cytochrome c nitrite reductase small subunit